MLALWSILLSTLASEFLVYDEFAELYNTIILVTPEECSQVFDERLRPYYLVIPTYCKIESENLTAHGIRHGLWKFPYRTDPTFKPCVSYEQGLPIDKCIFRTDDTSAFLVLLLDFLSNSTVLKVYTISDVNKIATIHRNQLTPTSQYPVTNHAFLPQMPLLPETMMNLTSIRDTEVYNFLVDYQQRKPASLSCFINTLQRLCLSATSVVNVWYATEEERAGITAMLNKAALQSCVTLKHYGKDFGVNTPVERVYVRLHELVDGADEALLGQRLRRIHELTIMLILFRHGGWFFHSDIMVRTPISFTSPVIFMRGDSFVPCPMYVPDAWSIFSMTLLRLGAHILESSPESALLLNTIAYNRTLWDSVTASGGVIICDSDVLYPQSLSRTVLDNYLTGRLSYADIESVFKPHISPVIDTLLRDADEAAPNLLNQVHMAYLGGDFAASKPSFKDLTVLAEELNMTFIKAPSPIFYNDTMTITCVYHGNRSVSDWYINADLSKVQLYSMNIQVDLQLKVCLANDLNF